MPLDKTKLEADIRRTSKAAAEAAYTIGIRTEYDGDPEEFMNEQARRFGEEFARVIDPALADQIDKYVQALFALNELSELKFDNLETPLGVTPNESIQDRFERDYGNEDIRGDLLDYLKERVRRPFGAGFSSDPNG